MQFVIFISVVQSILFLGHWFLYRTSVRFLMMSSPCRLLALKVALGLLSVSLVLTSFFAFRHSSLAVRCLYTSAASWLGIFYLFILASILCWVFYGFTKLFCFPLNGKMLFKILLGMALIVSVYGFINAGVIRVMRISVSLLHCPSAWKDKTAVWVSDTHLGQVRKDGCSEQIATRIKMLHPDIVFIGGDLYDRGMVDLDKMVEPFSRISVPYGIYFITGNHEEFYDNKPYLEAVRRAGIKVLYNEKMDWDGLQIVGVDYRDSTREGQFRRILQKMEINPQQPSILLKHTPLHLKVAQEQGISLQLSGHTHQGQVFLFRFITSKFYRGYDYGLKWFGHLLVYTSSGAGTWGPPMRIDTKPEMVIIKFI
jgi:predicted MPP superfamily phosphohydrolase